MHAALFAGSMGRAAWLGSAKESKEVHSDPQLNCHSPLPKHTQLLVIF